MKDESNGAAFRGFDAGVTFAVVAGIGFTDMTFLQGLRIFVALFVLSCIYYAVEYQREKAAHEKEPHG